MFSSVVFLATIFSSSSIISGELFTAVVDLEKLLQTEAEIVKTVEQYLVTEEKRLQEVRRLREDYSRLHEAASQDGQSFLANPVNAYLLVKKLTSDWKTAKDLLLGNEGREMIENMTRDRDDLKFPDDEDLSGAALALLRLQDTYKLDTSTLARGQIQGTKSSPELTAGDCFELGRQSYNNGDHYHTVLWMQEAMDRVDEEHEKTVSRADILEYLAFSTYMQGNSRHALKLTNDLLQLLPDHPRAQGNRVYYEDNIKKSEERKRGDDGEVPFESHISATAFNKKKEVTEREMYEKLCRGEKSLTPEEESKMKCRYRTNGHPFLLLQPVREEEVFLKPLIVIFHQVVSIKESDVIMSLAQPLLKRATVQNYKSGELEVASYRISKSAWLRNHDHPVVARVSRRVDHVTGLTVGTAEELQVVNYGIGGHYEPHFDFARREEKNAFKNLGTGNRIATWLTYLSDVDAGGATVFPHLGIALWPKKGSVAFWYNLHKNGEGDMLTRHAACPVLAGSKWVANKWLHEQGQEFRRPCGLKLND